MASLDLAEANLAAILRREAVRVSPKEFTLASGRKSNVYVDCKQVTMTPVGSWMVSEAFAHWLRDYGSGRTIAFGGPEIGACPIVTAVGMLCMDDEADAPCWENLQLFYVRKEAKGHGVGGMIVGPPIAPGTPAILVEDVVTTGGSLLRAIVAARVAGMIVERAYCLVDRQEGGRELLAKNGVELWAVATLADLYTAPGAEQDQSAPGAVACDPDGQVAPAG